MSVSRRSMLLALVGGVEAADKAIAHSRSAAPSIVELAGSSTETTMPYTNFRRAERVMWRLNGIPGPWINTDDGRWLRLNGGSNDVTAYGARGDGVADDTDAIQQAIDSSPDCGTIYFPVGIYKVRELKTGQKSITLQGSGWRANVSGFLGNESFRRASLLGGSVLRFGGQNEIALQCSPTSAVPIHLKDILLVGSGGRDTVGIRLESRTPGNAIINCLWSNVGVMNFGTGIQAISLLNSAFHRIKVVGCDVGWHAPRGTNGVNSNNNSWYDFETYFTRDKAFWAVDAAGLRFFGPLIQNLDPRAPGVGICLEETKRNQINDIQILSPWLEHGPVGTFESISVRGGRNIWVVAAHAAGSARIVFHSGTGHCVVGGRFTGAGDVISLGRETVDCVVRDVDLDGAGRVRNEGANTIGFRSRARP
jgi:hypothetical protein